MEMYWERQLLVFVAWSAHYNGEMGRSVYGEEEEEGDDNGSMASSCVSK